MINNDFLSLPKDHADSLPTETLMKWLEEMILIRKFEEKASGVYTMGKIGGFCHLCIGQEAIPVVSSYLMKPQDTMITAYRSHGNALARGLSPVAVMSELMGKKTGSSGGKGGSMHLFHKENGFYGGHGIVGAQTALGTGLAFSHKYKKDDGVCLTFLGDGATNQGQFFEAMNMAALWGLPVLYIIENNRYAMGTSVERACAGGPLWKRGEPFGIRGHSILGEDCFLLHHTFTQLLEHVRAVQKPFLLEIDTYRFKGHSMSDPGKYRTRESLDEARDMRDPIKKLRTFLQETRGISIENLEILEKDVLAVVNAALHDAEQSEEPHADTLWTDVLKS